MINFYEIREELKYLENMYRKILRCLQGAPDGTLFYRGGSNDRPGVPYLSVQQDGVRTRRSMKSEDPQVVRRLKYKTFARRLKRTVKNDIDALRGILKYKPLGTSFKEFGGKEFAECRAYFFGDDLPENETFAKLEERQNPAYPEDLKLETDLGVFRTKLEYIVALILTNLGLTFKYETPLWTGTRWRYPDFCVLHPGTGRIVYLEVAGKMKDPQYRAGLLSRVHEYGNVNVLLGINLFIIAEDPDAGIDMAALTELIRGIFSL